MLKHNMVDWRFEFDNARARLGVCKFRTKTISLSRHFTEKLNTPEVQDVILHEIAHAIVGGRHGHDYVWKSKCIEIGCNPDRLYNGEVRVESKYTAVCPVCGQVHNRNRKPTRQVSCGKCSRIFNPKSLLTYTQNW